MRRQKGCPWAHEVLDRMAIESIEMNGHEMKLEMKLDDMDIVSRIGRQHDSQAHHSTSTEHRAGHSWPNMP